jgi:hypothetical protein
VPTKNAKGRETGERPEIIYLHATGMELGLLVNFGHYPRLEWERIEVLAELPAKYANGREKESLSRFFACLAGSLPTSARGSIVCTKDPTQYAKHTK